MPAHVKDLTGMTFDRLKVIKKTEKRSLDKCVIWKCECACGNIVEVAGARLTSKNVKSCGCLRVDFAKVNNLIHGLKKHPLYQVWSDMKQRCNNPNSPAYLNYGGRGITVCEEWDKNFESFYDWSLSNGYVKGIDLDREDNDKGYSPDNCRFVSRKVNSRNRRTGRIVVYEGEQKTLAEVSEITGKKYSLLWHRIVVKGLAIEDALL